MPYQTFLENWKSLCDLLDNIPQSENEQFNALMNRYIEQNLFVLNDMMTISIENIKRLQKATTPNDIICLQARFTQEISQQLSLSTQRFLNASLGCIGDYNEWLKAHCDLATD